MKNQSKSFKNIGFISIALASIAMLTVVLLFIAIIVEDSTHTELKIFGAKNATDSWLMFGAIVLLVAVYIFVMLFTGTKFLKFSKTQPEDILENKSEVILYAVVFMIFTLFFGSAALLFIDTRLPNRQGIQNQQDQQAQQAQQNQQAQKAQKTQQDIQSQQNTQAQQLQQGQQNPQNPQAQQVLQLQQGQQNIQNPQAPQDEQERKNQLKEEKKLAKLNRKNLKYKQKQERKQNRKNRKNRQNTQIQEYADGQYPVEELPEEYAPAYKDGFHKNANRVLDANSVVEHSWFTNPNDPNGTTNEYANADGSTTDAYTNTNNSNQLALLSEGSSQDSAYQTNSEILNRAKNLWSDITLDVEPDNTSDREEFANPTGFSNKPKEPSTDSSTPKNQKSNSSEANKPESDSKVIEVDPFKDHGHIIYPKRESLFKNTNSYGQVGYENMETINNIVANSINPQVYNNASYNDPVANYYQNSNPYMQNGYNPYQNAYNPQDIWQNYNQSMMPSYNAPNMGYDQNMMGYNQPNMMGYDQNQNMMQNYTQAPNMMQSYDQSQNMMQNYDQDQYFDEYQDEQMFEPNPFRVGLANTRHIDYLRQAMDRGIITEEEFRKARSKALDTQVAYSM